MRAMDRFTKHARCARLWTSDAFDFCPRIRKAGVHNSNDFIHVEIAHKLHQVGLIGHSYRKVDRDLWLYMRLIFTPVLLDRPKRTVHSERLQHQRTLDNRFELLLPVTVQGHPSHPDYEGQIRSVDPGRRDVQNAHRTVASTVHVDTIECINCWVIVKKAFLAKALTDRSRSSVASGIGRAEEA
jgi:hypothetical protein